jgi:hypothetical protein
MFKIKCFPFLISTSVASPGEYIFLWNGRNEDEIRACFFDLEEDATRIRIVRLKECQKPGITERGCVSPSFVSTNVMFLQGAT